MKTEIKTSQLIDSLKEFDLIESATVNDKFIIATLASGGKLSFDIDTYLESHPSDIKQAIAQSEALNEEEGLTLRVFCNESKETPVEDDLMEDALSDIKKEFDKLEVGMKTTFGVVTRLGSDWAEFKAKDTPKTKIKWNARKGRDSYVLKHLKIIEQKNESKLTYQPTFGGRKDPLMATAASVLKKVRG